MEHINKIIAWELLFILVFSSLLVIDAYEPTTGGKAPQASLITGRQTLNPASVPSSQTVLAELEEAIPTLDFVSELGDVSVCLIVNINTTTAYSYEVIKIGEAIAITSATQKLCKGTAQEDFIISYVSYAKLREHLDASPSFETFKQTADGTNFYVYPSKHIEPGLIIADPASFKEEYGTFLSNHFTPDEIERALNPTVSAEEREAASLASYVLYFIIGLVVVVLVISVFIFTHTKKPDVGQTLEIVSYIKSSVAQGYQPGQVRQALLQSGWTEEQIQEGFKQANIPVAAPPGFSQ